MSDQVDLLTENSWDAEREEAAHTVTPLDEFGAKLDVARKIATRLWEAYRDIPYAITIREYEVAFQGMDSVPAEDWAELVFGELPPEDRFNVVSNLVSYRGTVEGVPVEVTGTPGGSDREALLLAELAKVRAQKAELDRAGVAL